MARLFYQDTGSGKPVVLLHGFLESHAIWNQLAAQLSLKFRVICFDMPGFGKSPLPTGDYFSIADVADEILDVLKQLTSERITVIGHSLGGYVTLAMAKRDPDRIVSFCLFHSTALADTPEKKESRTKTIDFVRRNGALPFTSNFIPPLFANPAHPFIPVVRDIAITCGEQTVVGYLQAMRDRPELTDLVRSYEGQILFIAGSHDSVIPVSTVEKQAKQAKNGSFSLLKDAGHMGMFEAVDESLLLISAFLEEHTLQR